MMDRTGAKDAWRGHCRQVLTHPDEPSDPTPHPVTVRAMRSTAQRIQALHAEAKEFENEILALVRQQASSILESDRSPQADLGQLV
ncbi:hypothetical protein [Streptomyces sp. NPDC051001]|uniref:hypothetical protein n=1 Tax=Streptomyces sp. NPDC051001 TaxID=3155795 RepID=UPI003443C831